MVGGSARIAKMHQQGKLAPRERVQRLLDPDAPWLELVIDRAQAKDRGVSIDDVRTTLESTLGPYYINDFNRFGRTWQVNVQAQETFRQSAEDVKQVAVAALAKRAGHPPE